MISHLKYLAPSACVVALAVATAAPASAKIQCQGNFQITKHGPIATPYCEEEQIAKVARAYGENVTAAEVRKNPLKKVYLCLLYTSPSPRD